MPDTPDKEEIEEDVLSQEVAPQLIPFEESLDVI